MANTGHDKDKYPKGGGANAPVVCDELVEVVQECLGMRMFKSQIKAKIAEWINPPGTPEDDMIEVSPPTVEKLIRMAREANTARVMETLEAHKADAIELYSSCIRDRKAYWKDRLVAQTRIDQLMGLDAPKAKEPVGGSETAEERAAKIREQLKAVDEATDGQ